MHQNILGAYTFIQIQLKYHWGHNWVGPFDMGPYHMGPFTIGPFSIRAFFCVAFAHIPLKNVSARKLQIFYSPWFFHSARLVNCTSFPACTFNNYGKFSSLNIYYSLHNYQFLRIFQPAHLFHLHNYLRD